CRVENGALQELDKGLVDGFGIVVSQAFGCGDSEVVVLFLHQIGEQTGAMLGRRKTAPLSAKLLRDTRSVCWGLEADNSRRDISNGAVVAIHNLDQGDVTEVADGNGMCGNSRPCEEIEFFLLDRLLFAVLLLIFVNPKSTGPSLDQDFRSPLVGKVVQ